MNMDHRGLPRPPRDGAAVSTEMLLALAAAKQASSATSMAQARLTLPAQPRPQTVPARVALFSDSQRSAVRGSFDPDAASIIDREDG